MGRLEPVAAFNEAQLMLCLPAEKQSPAFPADLNAIGQSEKHRLIDPANAVDAQLFDDDFFEDLRFFGFLFFAFYCFFIHQIILRNSILP